MTKEEAIDNVRSFIGQLTAECQESIHTLIPELAESEDERIRKALIDGIRQIRCKNGVTQEQMLAWLEKQKEQKHPDGCFTCDEYKKGYEEGRRNGFTAGYNKAMKEVEQKEQKPECDNETEVQKAYREGKNAGRKEVLDHPEYYGLQLRRMYDYETGERNPEWSDEDEEMLKSILFVLESYVSHSESASSPSLITSYPIYYKEIDWLKSLRPSWKPSEEQMEILQYVCTQSSHPNQKVIRVLESLYNDLKKL